MTTVGPDNLNMVRLQADGTADTRFGDHGYLSFPSPVEWGSDAVQVRALADGRLLVAGNLFGDGFPYAVMRVNTDGSLDSRFGHDGVVTFDSSLLSYGDGGIAVQGDGKVVLSGNAYDYNSANIVRLNADGSYDASFGSGGVVLIPRMANAEGCICLTAQVAPNQGQATGQYQPGNQVHKGLAGKAQGKASSNPETDKYHWQQAHRKEQQRAVSVHPGEQEQCQSPYSATADQSTLRSTGLLDRAQSRVQIQRVDKAAAAKQCAK